MRWEHPKKPRRHGPVWMPPSPYGQCPLVVEEIDEQPSDIQAYVSNGQRMLEAVLTSLKRMRNLTGRPE